MSKASQTKISRALGILNASMSRKAKQRYRTVVNKPDLTCPVCHKADCKLDWTDVAHSHLTTP